MTETTILFNARNAIMVDDISFGRMEAKIDSLNDKIESIEHTLNGNGRPGVIDKTTRNELLLEQLGKDISELRLCIEKLSDTIGTTNDSISALSNTVSEHVKDPIHTPEGYMAKYWKKVLLFLIVVILLVEVIVPPNVSVWDILSKTIGL